MHEDSTPKAVEVMNDSELDRLLKSVPEPGRPESYWAQFPRRVLSRLHWKPAGRPEKLRPWVPRLGWGLAAVASCLLAGFVFGHWHTRRGSDSFALLQNRKVILEMLSLFPNRVRAIVQDDRGLRVVLADRANIPVSAPLWVKICDGKHCQAAVTFSGQDIELAGRQITVLADARGGVLLVGNDFAWSSEKPAESKAPLVIQTKNLGPLAM